MAGELIRGQIGEPQASTAVLDVAAAEPVQPLGLAWPRRAFRRDSLRRRSLAVADTLAVLAALYLATLLAGDPAPLWADLALGAALPLWVLLNKLLGLYDRDANVISKSTLDELPRIAQSVVVGGSLVFFLASALPGLEFAAAQAMMLMAAGFLLLPALRLVTRRALAHWASPERCLIAGSGSLAREIAGKLARHPEHGVALVGFIGEPPSDGDASPPHPVLGSLEDFERVCRDLEVERVVIASSSLSDEELLLLLRASKDLYLKVSLVPRLFEARGEAIEFEEIEGMSLLGLRGLSRTTSSLRLKRAVDFLGASVGLLVLAPLLIAIAIAIRLDSRGPALFSQWRIGRDNRPFRMYKFRTMRGDAEELKPDLAHLNEAAEPMFKIADDPRLTRVGRLLRRFSLDELPQLWNVVRGEMSLVGPRPLVPDEDLQVIGRHRARLNLTPGLTGPWQVMGRTAIPFPEMIKLDYLYVAEWSLWNDIKLLLRTAPVVLSGRGH